MTPCSQGVACACWNRPRKLNHNELFGGKDCILFTTVFPAASARAWWRLGLNQCLLEEHGCFLKNICRSGAEEEVTQSAEELSEGQYHLRREQSQLEALELLHTRSQGEVGGTPGRG